MYTATYRMDFLLSKVWEFGYCVAYQSRSYDSHCTFRSIAAQRIINSCFRPGGSSHHLFHVRSHINSKILKKPNSAFLKIELGLETDWRCHLKLIPVETLSNCAQISTPLASNLFYNHTKRFLIRSAVITCCYLLHLLCVLTCMRGRITPSKTNLL